MAFWGACFDDELVHFLAELFGSVVLAVELEVEVDEGVDVEAVAEDPLFVAPVACWELSDEGSAVGASVFHPCHCLFDCGLEEVGSGGSASIECDGDQEQGGAVARSAVEGIVYQGGDMAEAVLVGCGVFEDAFE